MAPKKFFLKAYGVAAHDRGKRVCVTIIAVSYLATLGYPSYAAEADGSQWEISTEAELIEANSDDASAQALSSSEPANGLVADDDIDISEAERDQVLDEALQAAERKAPNRNARITNRQLARQIEQQFKAISEFLEQEDSYHAELGELYFSYANSLLEAAEFEEARDAFANSLHIAKVNNGIYALEQRPALRGLFETTFAQGETEIFEDYLNRILWLEEKHEVKDGFALDLLIKVGNGYIDRFLARPVAGETGLLYLQKASRYLSYAVRRYGELPLAEVRLPYGELALANTLEGKLVPRIDNSVLYDVSRQRGGSDIEQQRRTRSYLSASFNRGEHYLNKYLIKAQAEESLEDTAKALIQLGDLNLLFKRTQAAKNFYQLAWGKIDELPEDHELRGQMAEPVQLPAYNYASQREFVPTARPTKLVPLKFSLNENGEVEDIVQLDEDDINQEYYPRARRAAKKLLFRPAIIDGELVAVDGIQRDIRVFLKREKEKAQATGDTDKNAQG